MTPTPSRPASGPFKKDDDMAQTPAQKAAPLQPGTLPPLPAPDASDAPMRIALNWAVLIGGMAALMYLGNMLLQSV